MFEGIVRGPAYRSGAQVACNTQNIFCKPFPELAASGAKPIVHFTDVLKEKAVTITGIRENMWASRMQILPWVAPVHSGAQFAAGLDRGSEERRQEHNLVGIREKGAGTGPAPILAKRVLLVQTVD
jgi:hypothetical protein